MPYKIFSSLNQILEHKCHFCGGDLKMGDFEFNEIKIGGKRKYATIDKLRIPLDEQLLGVSSAAGIPNKSIALYCEEHLYILYFVLVPFLRIELRTEEIHIHDKKEEYFYHISQNFIDSTTMISKVDEGRVFRKMGHKESKLISIRDVIAIELALFFAEPIPTTLPLINIPNTIEELLYKTKTYLTFS